MLKALSIFVILLALAIYSVSASAAPPALACGRLFSVDDKAYAAINDFLITKKQKNQLMDHSIRSEDFKTFIIEYSNLVDKIFTEEVHKIFAGENKSYPLEALGFKSIQEHRTMKEDYLRSQLELLASMNLDYFTKEFKEDVLWAVKKIFSPELTKYELLMMKLSMQNRYYSRM